MGKTVAKFYVGGWNNQSFRRIELFQNYCKLGYGRKDYTYIIIFNVDGHRTQETVSANSYNDAKRIIEARYRGANLYFSSFKQIN